MSAEKQKQVDYRTRVRWREFDLIISAIKEIIPDEKIGKLRILDFGCGSCEGAQNLCQLGHLIASDISKSPLLNLPVDAEFRIADIHQTGFEDSQFDILFSSQVLEHLRDLGQAFREMKRIARNDAYYVFSIPTAAWLVLSVPAKILKKLKNIRTRIRGHSKRSNETTARKDNDRAEHVKKRWLSRFSLGGHGCYPRFCECFRAFRVGHWKRVLLQNGFQVLAEIPLLTYADSDVPLLPPSRFLAQLGLASSYLFICTNADAAQPYLP
jgi:SAM-dependent methyltransferase